MAHTQALQKLRDLFEGDPARAKTLISDWFVRYHVDLYTHGVPFEVYVEKVRAIRQGLRSARRVLDLGSGFGVYSALMRILGIPEVVAVDYHIDKARGMKRLWEHLGLDGLSFLNGDGTHLPFRPGTFDGAIVLAALSHINEPEIAVEEAARVIRKGGTLYVFEDNNSSYPRYEKGMAPVWDAMDLGTGSAGTGHVRPGKRPFCDIRRELIAQQFPDLSGPTLETCVKLTRGLYGTGIVRGVEEYLRTGRLPNPYRKVARDPVSGEFAENPLNPTIVQRTLRRAGFVTRLCSPVTGPYRGRRAALKWLVARAFQVCPALLHRTWPTFVVIGVRS